MIRYYCSGFDINNAFGHGLGEMFKTELKDTKSIIYIPGSPEKIEKAKLNTFQFLLNILRMLGLNLNKSI
jgi:hypothetical protein